MFGQTFQPQDLAVVGLLVVLEGVLSIDNALVLGLLAKRLPKHLQKRALTYGLVGAFVFRLIAIATAAYLLEWRIAKLLGGAYLIYIAAKHFVSEWRQDRHEKITLGPDGEPMLVNEETGKPLTESQGEEEVQSRGALPVSRETLPKRKGPAFWPTVGVIELTDVAFAIDSILAAIAMISSVPKPAAQRFHPKLWVVLVGGMLGVILMRFAAIIFIKMLERFPRFEIAAYLLVTVIGAKLVVDWHFNRDPHHPMVDFHSPGHVPFWIFWGLMLICFCVGFLPQRSKSKPSH